MKIAGAVGAFPPHRYRHVITNALRAYWGEKLQRPELVARLHSRADVDYRNLAYSLLDYKRLDTRGQSNCAWIETVGVHIARLGRDDDIVSA